MSEPLQAHEYVNSDELQLESIPQHQSPTLPGDGSI